ncbi:aminopeptidase P, putative [Plasmodium gallinaceum]|uniref:Aminopeptidase P, putative n=1 Tax=Plasmodium gallinaceum TaxID=5849 RepID=A0A1J1GQK5_PLAGA|nr:aminopeptidase P, putative [Plasmodium gallinaceum]CRG94739.1 aminopeptidase P, putative [Plasmodium gallinaceum]
MHLKFILYVFFFLMVFHLSFINRRKGKGFIAAYYLNSKIKSQNNINEYPQNKINEFCLNNKVCNVLYAKYFKKVFENLNLRANQEDKKGLPISNNLNNIGKSYINTINETMAEDHNIKPHKTRLEELKTVMKRNNIDVYILMNNDEHNSEIINDKDKKIYFLSNFSGADGTLIITQDEQILYVNALYELQANKELDKDIFTLKIIRINNREEIYDTISSLQFNNIAFDGKNTGVRFFEKLRKSISQKYTNRKIEEKVIYGNNFDYLKQNNNINLLILENSLVEIKNFEVNTKSVFIHDLTFNGSSIAEKIAKMKYSFIEEIKDVNNILISELDEIAYFLNLRGYDYKFSPLFYSYLLFQFNRQKNDFDKIILFTIVNNLTEEVKDYLNKNNIIIKDYESVIEYLRDNISTKLQDINGSKTVIDLTEDNYNNTELISYDISLSPFINLIIYMLFNKKNVLLQNSPIVNMKAIKNDIEIENMKEAHILDALALLQFFHWVNEKKKSKELFNETEISLKNKIDYFRSTKKNFLFPSFATISAIGPNAAIIHYESTESSNTKISPNIYLLDSGGQYLHGTTDVTRTTHFGEPTEEEKKAYTLVLKGHLHLRKVIFASYTNSLALDFMARSYLFKNYMDYSHGTGHGVGLSLNVHEGGCSISPVSGTPLKENMVLSNEPGYYLENKFGIRIENMQYVIVKKKKDNTEYLSFNDLTVYPYEKKLLDFSLLNQEEIRDINEYHDNIRKTLLPLLKENPTEYDEGIIDYLMEITEPILI